MKVCVSKKSKQKVKSHEKVYINKGKKKKGHYWSISDTHNNLDFNYTFTGQSNPIQTSLKDNFMYK